MDFIYCVGTTGMCLSETVSQCVAQYTNYSYINARAVYQAYVDTGVGNEKDTSKIKNALAENKFDLEPSIACPLVIAEVEKYQKLGYTKFIFTDFPVTKKQQAFLEYKLVCKSKALVFDYSLTDALELGSKVGSQVQSENDV